MYSLRGSSSLEKVSLDMNGWREEANRNECDFLTSKIVFSKTLVCYNYPQNYKSQINLNIL